MLTQQRRNVLWLVRMIVLKAYLSLLLHSPPSPFDLCHWAKHTCHLKNYHFQHLCEKNLLNDWKRLWGIAGGKYNSWRDTWSRAIFLHHQYRLNLVCSDDFWIVLSVWNFMWQICVETRARCSLYMKKVMFLY